MDWLSVQVITHPHPWNVIVSDEVSLLISSPRVESKCLQHTGENGNHLNEQQLSDIHRKRLQVKSMCECWWVSVCGHIFSKHTPHTVTVSVCASVLNVQKWHQPSGISDYLSFLVGSVVSIATLSLWRGARGASPGFDWIVVGTTRNAAGEAQHAWTMMVWLVRSGGLWNNLRIHTDKKLPNLIWCVGVFLFFMFCSLNVISRWMAEAPFCPLFEFVCDFPVSVQ